MRPKLSFPFWVRALDQILLRVIATQILLQITVAGLIALAQVNRIIGFFLLGLAYVLMPFLMIGTIIGLIWGIVSVRGGSARPDQRWQGFGWREAPRNKKILGGLIIVVVGLPMAFITMQTALGPAVLFGLPAVVLGILEAISIFYGLRIAIIILAWIFRRLPPKALGAQGNLEIPKTTGEPPLGSV